jgi:hypothetical protein
VCVCSDRIAIFVIVTVFVFRVNIMVDEVVRESYLI